MSSAKPKYSRAVKRRARAYLNFINNRTEPLEEASRDITALVEHPGLLGSDDYDPVDDMPYTLEDEDTYFVGFGLSNHEDYTIEAKYSQPEISSPTIPNLFGTASMYHIECFSPSESPEKDHSGRVTPDFINNPGYYPEINALRDSAPSRDLNPYFDGNSIYPSQYAPRSTTPEGEPKRGSHSPYYHSNAQHIRQIYEDPGFERRTGVRNPFENRYTSILEREYANYASYGSAIYIRPSSPGHLSNASGIQSRTPSPFELRHEGSPSRLFGPVESPFQSWAASNQSIQSAANSDCRHDLRSSDRPIPSSTLPNTVHLSSSTLQNGTDRQLGIHNKQSDVENVDSTPVPTDFKEDKGMETETKTFERGQTSRKSTGEDDFLGGRTFQRVRLDDDRTKANVISDTPRCMNSLRCMNSSSCTHCSANKMERIEGSDNETNKLPEGPEIKGGKHDRAEQEIQDKNKVSQNTGVGDANYMSPSRERSWTEAEIAQPTENKTSLSASEHNGHSQRSGQLYPGRLYPQSPITRAAATPLPHDSFSSINTNPYLEIEQPAITPNNSESLGVLDDETSDGSSTAGPDSVPDLIPPSSNDDDTMYDVELSSSNPSSGSEDADWVTVARGIEDDDAVNFARQIFSSIDRRGESSRAELLELVLQILGPRRAVGIITRRRPIEQMSAEQHDELDEQTAENGEVDDWVPVPEMEDR